MKQKLSTKDLITAGAFGAIYVVLITIVSTVLAMTPITFLLTPFVMGIVGSVVYMLYVSKIKKPGAILILAVLVGIITSGTSIYPLLLAVIWGAVAELIVRKGDYKAKGHIVASYCIFNFTSIGPLFLLVIAKKAFLENCAVYYGQEYVETMDNYTPSWIALVFVALAIVGALLGGQFSKRLLNKHFEKVGIWV